MLSLHVLDSDGEYLGYLHSATRIAYLAELNGPGGGSFEINPGAADAALVQPERIIEVRWLTGAIGQWVIQTMVEPLVGSTKAAMMKVSGQGLLGLLRKMVLYPHAWPALTDADALDAPLVCAPNVGMGFLGLFTGNVELPFTLNFSPTKDTNLTNWPNDVYLEFRPGQTMLDVVNGLAGLGHDFIVSAQRTLDAYVEAGNNVRYTIVFIEGQNLLSLTRTTESADLATVALGAGQTAMVQSTDFTWTTRRRQAYLPVRNATDEQQVAAANALFLERVRQPVQSYELVVRNSPIALYDYRVGDTIGVVTRQGQLALRVLSIHVEQNGQDQIVRLGVNETAMGLSQRMATAINAQATMAAASAGRLVAPDVRVIRAPVAFDWMLSGTVIAGDGQGGVIAVRSRLQILELTGGCTVAPRAGEDMLLSMEYSLDGMDTWTDLYSTDPIVGGGQLAITDGVLALTILQPGTYLRFNVDNTGHEEMQNLRVRLRTREV